MEPTPRMVHYPLGPVSHRARLCVGPFAEGRGPPTQSGRTPARAERVLHFHACVVTAGEQDVYFDINPAEPSPRALRSAFPLPYPGDVAP